MSDKEYTLLGDVPLYALPTDVELLDFDDASTTDIAQLPTEEVTDGQNENGLVTLTDDELKKFHEIVYGTSGATEAKLHAFFGSSSRNWDQLCQASAWNACYHFGHASTNYASANSARHASKIVGTNPAKAVAGDWHFFAIGAYGHVSGALGGSRTWMASKHIDVHWGVNVGATTVERYVARTGARYVGYAHGDGVNDFAFAAPTSSVTADQKHVMKLTTWLNAQRLGYKSTAAQDGKRGKIYYLEVQTWGSTHNKVGEKVARSKSLYPQGFIFDGDPGNSSSQTRKIESLLMKAHG